MTAENMCSWRVTEIDMVVFVRKGNDSGFMRIGGKTLKTFEDRRYHGLVLKTDGISSYAFRGFDPVRSLPGSVTYLPQGYPYTVESVEPGSCYCVTFRIDGTAFLPPFTVMPRNTAQWLGYFTEMLDCWVYQRPGFRARILARLYDMFATLEEDRTAKYLPSHQKSQLRSLTERISADPAQPLQISALARECGMSETYFRRLFHEAYGVSPKQYIQGLRFRLAKSMLTGTDRPIADIARECGFENICTFSRAFHTSEHISPTEYRLLHTE